MIRLKFVLNSFLIRFKFFFNSFLIRFKFVLNSFWIRFKFYRGHSSWILPSFHYVLGFIRDLLFLILILEAGFEKSIIIQKVFTPKMFYDLFIYTTMQFLAEQLTLSHPGGADYALHSTTRFLDLAAALYENCSKKLLWKCKSPYFSTYLVLL